MPEIPQNHHEFENGLAAAKQSPTLLEGLSYLGHLKEAGLDFRFVDDTLQAPLQRLFAYAQIDMSLGGRDRRLSELAPQFFDNPDTGRWLADTDLAHTIASFGYLSEISAKEGFTLSETKIALSAIIVHDCCYPATKDFETFTSSDVRLLHMQEGAREFRLFAEKVNKEFENFYTPEEITVVAAIVMQHDNPSIKAEGKPMQFHYDPPPEKLMWAHREADRLWMFDKGGFALDLARRVLEKNPWFDPKKYLLDIIYKHLEEADNYWDNEDCIPVVGIKSLYRTKTGFDIFIRLIQERISQYQNQDWYQ